MNHRFDAFRATKLGMMIEASARRPERIIEYALLSRLGMPAVIALSWDLAPHMRELSEGERREAKQFAGAIVGDIMREQGYIIINARGSAQAGGVFTLGAVWGSSQSDDAKTRRIADEIADEYSETLSALARS